ncbi:dihydrodipicolinate synthase family protein [Thalassobacillus devorans]|uniref:Dihydrodipicolinate synthase family protein n=1 Tax=Thalassobacillus devorans TaxID=279813 RepID=A0ABQ1NVA6_9BACI|nr:dihydrodipicolinate synthase family protein [Thalassobacillus devorans]NIK28757.1 4-hydroxy-tetrahydrodipicolinate synthase [Thalassobacillus devorans]GGC83787.1 dihydrodipicolinate synthase family protein [Thalassobacillus devorans]
MKFKGIIPPVVTLFDETGNLDLELNRKYMDVLIEQNVHGILLMGSSGEFSSLTLEERKLYMREMIKHIDNRVPVLVGVGHTVLKEVLDLCNYAELQGADGLLVVNPYYWNLSEDQLYRFYSIIAENSKLPILLYNIPSFTGQPLTVELIKKLAGNYPNICGIKETVSEFSHINEMITELKKVRQGFMVFSAFDEHALPALVNGSAGSINGSSVFAPEISVSLYEAFKENQMEKAEANHQQLVKLMDLYTYCPSFFTTMKEAVHQRWFPGYQAGHRAPFDVYPNDLSEKVSILLKTIKLKEGMKS